MPNLRIKIPDYDKNARLQYSWEDGFKISTDLQDNVVISVLIKPVLIHWQNSFLPWQMRHMMRHIFTTMSTSAWKTTHLR
jgi:hypothetical protein